MATGTVLFQSTTIASPPAGLAVMADAVNDSSLGAGSAQYIKIMDAAVGGTAKASVTTANGLAVDVTRAQGYGAHGAAVAGNPVLISGFGSSGTQAAVTDGQTVRAWFDLNGRLQVSASSLPLPTSAATETTLGTRLSESDFDTKAGSLTETAPTTDTASSGLNGRLQRIAQNITTLIAKFGTALAVAIGQQTRANSLPVVLPSDATGTNALQAQGAATAGSAIAGNPVMIGGSDGTNARTLALSTGGLLSLGVGGAGDGLTATADVQLVGGANFALAVYPYNFNGTTADRKRGNDKTTPLASAARTATVSANITLYNNCALLLVVDVTARAAATTLTPSLVMGQSGFVANKTVWTAAAAINTGSGTTMYVLWPLPTIGAPTGYAEVINTPLFREMQVTITHSDANSITYSVVAYTVPL